MKLKKDTNRKLVITAGLKTKYNSFAANFEYFFNGDVWPGMHSKPRRIDGVLMRFKIGRIYQNAKAIHQKIAKNKFDYDIIIIIKGVYILPKTLKYISEQKKTCKLVLWTPDDLFLSHNQTFWLRKSLKYYDLVVTAKELNIQNHELESLGARRVIFRHQAFDELLHKGIFFSESQIEEKVLFVGMFEQRRYDFLNFLAESGINVEVYGNGWDAVKNKTSSKLRIHGKPIIGTDYVKIISRHLVTIGFLRELNRDLHTTRTFEIPACFGLMLAERNTEQEKYFKEDYHSLYFDSKEELLSKVKWIMDNRSSALNIRRRGHEHCMSSGYSYRELIDFILSSV